MKSLFLSLEPLQKLKLFLSLNFFFQRRRVIFNLTGTSHSLIRRLLKEITKGLIINVDKNPNLGYFHAEP